MSEEKVGKKRKLLDVEFEVLISEVQSRPALWNDCHSDFKNSAITRKQWNVVGAAINLPGEEAKKKWKNLKDKFRKILQKPPLKSGHAPSTPKPKWKFYDLMHFTKDVLLPSCTIGNLTRSIFKEDITDTNPTNDDLPTEGDVFSDGAFLLPEQQLEKQQRTSSTSRSGLGRRFDRPHRAKSAALRKQKMEIKLIKLEKKTIDAILSTQNKNDQNDDYHFFMSLMPFVKILNPLEKLKVRSTIQTVIMDALRRQEARNSQEFDSRPSSGFSPSVSLTSNYSGQLTLQADNNQDFHELMDDPNK